jgi:adenine phosphoribosyltransferase
MGRTTKVLVVDDVLATGGTAAAAGRLAQGLGAVLAGWTFLLEIGPLEGRKRLGGTAPGFSLLTV